MNFPRYSEGTFTAYQTDNENVNDTEEKTYSSFRLDIELLPIGYGLY